MYIHKSHSSPQHNMYICTYLQYPACYADVYSTATKSSVARKLCLKQVGTADVATNALTKTFETTALQNIVYQHTHAHLVTVVFYSTCQRK